MGQDYHIAAFTNPGNLKKKCKLNLHLEFKMFQIFEVPQERKIAVFGAKIQTLLTKKKWRKYQVQFGSIFGAKIKFN